MLTIFFEEYDESYSDTELWMIANAKNCFKSIGGKSMYDLVTLGELYSIVIDAVDML